MELEQHPQVPVRGVANWIPGLQEFNRVGSNPPCLKPILRAEGRWRCQNSGGALLHGAGKLLESPNGWVL